MDLSWLTEVFIMKTKSLGDRLCGDEEGVDRQTERGGGEGIPGIC